MTNRQLDALLREAGFVLDDGQIASKRSARAVNDADVDWRETRPVTHTHVSRWRTGTTPRPKARKAIAAAIGTRLGRRIGLDELGWPSEQSISANLGLQFPTDGTNGIDDAALLWQADQERAHELLSAPVSVEAWARSTMAFRFGEPVTIPATQGSKRIGAADVAVIPSYVEAFDLLDGLHGGAHARESLLQFLRSSVAPMLRGSHSEVVGRQLYEATAEALRLAAWMTYDAGDHGLAQRHFIQSLWFAKASENPTAAGSVLDAMSHQAAFVGRPSEAAQMVRAAIDVTNGRQSGRMLAHFYAMEARALARAGDKQKCELALSRAATEFDAQQSTADMDWADYFDESEFAAEFAHCYLALGQYQKAAESARQSLAASTGARTRSDFFVIAVLASALAEAGDCDEASRTMLHGLEDCTPLRSDRCVVYLRDFRGRITADAIRTIDEHAGNSPLWQMSASPTQ